MSDVILDGGESKVFVKSGLDVSDPEGSGVIISSEGGGDLILKAGSGGSWQGPLQVQASVNGAPLLNLGFTGATVGFYSVVGVEQPERVGQLAPGATLAEVIAKVNALELVLHNVGLTK